MREAAAAVARSRPVRVWVAVVVVRVVLPCRTAVAVLIVSAQKMAKEDADAQLDAGRAVQKAVPVL